MPHLPEEVIERIINNLTSNYDRNSISLVNKLWYTVDRYTRRSVYVSNCYALSPERVITRFPNLRSLTLKGKPGITDPELIPNDWGGSVEPWIKILSKDCPLLVKLRLKRMIVSNQDLDMVSICFPNFKSLSLSSCSGFTIDGLSSIASRCSILEELELENYDVKDNNGQFLNSFPETLSSLVTLNISCVKGNLNPTDLERLVARSSKLTTLKLNETMSTNTIRKVLLKAPQLKHLGISSSLQIVEIPHFFHLSLPFQKCESIERLTFSYVLPLMLLRAVYPVCPNLVYLNMSSVIANNKSEQIEFIRNCPKLRILLVQDCIEDEGLEVVSKNCKNLENLSVFHGRGNIGVTEAGLVAISTGCQNLKTLKYFSRRMTNAALQTFSKNCPNVTSFDLTMSKPKQPDYTTLQPLDYGYGEIVKSCKNLRKLTFSGLLTDDVFLYIGMYAEKLEVFSVSNTGESGSGMQFVFNGCKNLRKVEISNCPFGDDVFLSRISECESLRSVWMDSCKTTFRGCKTIKQRNPSFKVEIMDICDLGMNREPDEEMKVGKMYVYRSFDGPRGDSPSHVWTL